MCSVPMLIIQWTQILTKQFVLYINIPQSQFLFSKYLKYIQFILNSIVKIITNLIEKVTVNYFFFFYIPHRAFDRLITTIDQNHSCLYIHTLQSSIEMGPPQIWRIYSICQIAAANTKLKVMMKSYNNNNKIIIINK